MVKIKLKRLKKTDKLEKTRAQKKKAKAGPWWKRFWEKTGNLLADAFLLILKPINEFSNWLATEITAAEKTMKKRRDYVIVLLVILALILVMLIIPLLDALMHAEG